MQTQRPNPDELLSLVQQAEAQAARGKLKVFFGMSAGVGKTFAMLEEAQQQQREGVDVVIGWVETHGRAETEALVQGLERLPPREIEYRGTFRIEFDLDGAMARRPALLLLDELAHTNVEGSRHPKRWQDVEELLHAGIDVYTTVNVQHLESLNDVVAQITGVRVRETVPDHVIERADEVELIDLPPDDLLRRLADGKVYVPQQATQAARNFFRKGNLIALRELALRRTADRVDAQMQHYMRANAINSTWPTAERLLVCIDASRYAPRLVRATRRLAASLRAEWIVVYVENPKNPPLSPKTRDLVVQTLRLAEQLGAQAITLSGHRPAETILQYAHNRNVTKLVAGKPVQPRWRDVLFGSVVDDLIRHSGEIDVYVISGEHDDTLTSLPAIRRPTSTRRAYLMGIVAVMLCTIIASLMFPYFELSNLIMVYLLGVVFTASRYGRGPSVLATILGVAAFDFLFVPPYLTFAVSDTQYLVTFGVMLVVATIISSLTLRMRQQADHAGRREQRITTLYGLSEELARTRGMENLIAVSLRHIADTFGDAVAILVPNKQGELVASAGSTTTTVLDPNEIGIARWVFDHQEMAGFGTNTLAGSSILYLPLVASGTTLGVLAVRPDDPQALLEPDQRYLLETLATQAALALERAQLAARMEQTPATASRH
jgi:two-component system, OmpR family, sensor histidine kinase KdpD